MRIMTGAPVPPGADTVIQVELTRSDGPESGWVEILEAVSPGNNIDPPEKIYAKGKPCCGRNRDWAVEDRRAGNARLGKRTVVATTARGDTWYRR